MGRRLVSAPAGGFGLHLQTQMRGASAMRAMRAMRALRAMRAMRAMRANCAT